MPASPLLAVQVVTIFVLVPLADGILPTPPGFEAFALLVFISLTIFVAYGRWLLAAAALTFALNASVVLAEMLHPGAPVDVAFDLSSLTTCAVLSAVVAIAVFQEGCFTAHRNRGLVVLYLNFGLLFAFLRRVVAELILEPTTTSPISATKPRFAPRSTISLATITSLGAGDMVSV